MASRWRLIVLRSGYVIFALYALVVAGGVLFSVYGMRPTFNEPKAWKATGSEPSSFLSYDKITEVPAADWARAFSRRTSPEDLAFRCVKNNIIETYLIAEGIPMKLAKLRRANTFYILSMGILFLWVTVTAIAVGSIDLFPSAAVAAIRASSAATNP
jgi:hypothetical protein